MHHVNGKRYIKPYKCSINFSTINRKKYGKYEDHQKTIERLFFSWSRSRVKGSLREPNSGDDDDSELSENGIFLFFKFLFLSDCCHSLQILNGYWVLKCFYFSPSAITNAVEAESKGSAPLEAKHAIGPGSGLVYSPIFENVLSVIGLSIIILYPSRPCKGTSIRYFRHKIFITS